MNKRYIKITGSTPYAGTEYESYLYTDMNEEDLIEYMLELANDHASNYEHLVLGWGETIDSYAAAQGIDPEDVTAMIDDFYATTESNFAWEEVTKENVPIESVLEV